MVNDNSWYSVANSQPEQSSSEPLYAEPLYPGDIYNPPTQQSASISNYQLQPEQKGFLGEAADLFRSVVPQGVRDFGGRTLRGLSSAEYALNLVSPQGRQYGTELGETIGSIPYAGGLARTAFDVGASPLTFLTAGVGAAPIAGVRGLGIAGKALGASPEIGSFGARALSAAGLNLAGTYGAEGGQYLAEKAGLSEDAQLAAGVAGGLLGGGLAASRLATKGIGAESAAKAFKPQTVAESVFGIKNVEPELSRTQTLLNHLKETTGFGVLDNEYSTPIMQERRRIREVTDSQANRIGNLADYVYNLFDTDKNGGLKQFGGAPTLQDVAAKLPLYAPDLNEKQLSGLTRLREELAPFNQALTEMGVTPNMRADIIDGGFYLPRGRALEEGVDQPLVRASSAMRGSKKGFERPEEFGTMATGIQQGYTYSPFSESLQSYIRDLGNRVGDQWATNQFKESGLGMTAKESLLASNPALAAKKDAIDNSLKKLLVAEKSLNDDTVRVIERFISDPDFTDIEELRAALPAAVKRGTYAGMSREDLQKALIQTKTDLNEIRGTWKTALERASQEPGAGSIGLYGLTGSSFPAEVSNVANKYLNQEMQLSGRGSQVLGITKAFNNIMRGLRASADLSFMGIQGLLGAATHPIQYGKAMKVALQSIADPDAFGKFVSTFDDSARQAGRLTSADWASLGSKISGGVTEFSPSASGRVGKLVGKLPGVAQSERAFSSFGDSLRLLSNDGLYRAMNVGERALSENELRQITKFSNLMTGYSNRRFAGDLGEIATFAPRFFQSQLDLLGSALLGGEPIVRDQAFKSLRNLIGVGTLLTYAANTARGEETSFNPDDPNFMRIRDVGGNDVSLFGPWDSLMRAISSAGKGDFSYIARTKASPAVGIAWDLLSGKTFTGKEVGTPEYFLRQLLPFGVSEIGTEPISKTAIGLTGVKASPLTVGEQVERGRYEQLTPEDQFRGINPLAWGVMKENFEDLGDSKNYGEWYQNTLEGVTKELIGRGIPKEFASIEANKLVQQHPYVEVYNELKNLMEMQWMASHPQEALKKFDEERTKPDTDKTKWKLTKDQTELLYAIYSNMAGTP